MKLIVLDDDPTGTQAASQVTVLLNFDPEALEEVLKDSDVVFIQTNSRSMSEDEAIVLVSQIRDHIKTLAIKIDEQIKVVLRGDSTLRGHTFSEVDVFLEDTSIILFVPAFPDAGRITKNGIHLIQNQGEQIPVDQTEFASDPVFHFATSNLSDYVSDKSGYRSETVSLESVRSGELLFLLKKASPGTVVIPDAETNEDIALIAHIAKKFWEMGGSMVVRSAAPLAAHLGEVQSAGLVPLKEIPHRRKILVVVGSHTQGALGQVSKLNSRGLQLRTIDTSEALSTSGGVQMAALDQVRNDLKTERVSVIGTERNRLSEHGTLEHGRNVMSSLMSTVSRLVADVDVVVSKGGITSAEVARVALGGVSARVIGQVDVGVSLWKIESGIQPPKYLIIVPGNVGDDDLLGRLVDGLIA